MRNRKAPHGSHDQCHAQLGSGGSSWPGGGPSSFWKAKSSPSKGCWPLRAQLCLSSTETPRLALFPSATLPPASATASFPPFNLNKTKLFFFFFSLAGTGRSCNISPLGSLGSHDTTFTHRPDYHHRALFLFPSTWLELGGVHTWGACRPAP